MINQQSLNSDNPTKNRRHSDLDCGEQGIGQVALSFCCPTTAIMHHWHHWITVSSYRPIIGDISNGIFLIHYCDWSTREDACLLVIMKEQLDHFVDSLTSRLNKLTESGLL